VSALRLPVAAISSAHRADVTTAVEAMEREGQPVTLVCLDTRRHEHEPTRADVLHVPLFSAGIAASFIGRLKREPLRTLRAFSRARFGLPSTIHVAQLLSRRGIVNVRGLDPIAAVVTQFLNATPPDLTDLPVDWSRLGANQAGLRWFSRQINSIAAEFSLEDRRVVVKRQRTHAGGAAADRWAHECSVLRSLHESMGDGRCTVPRVLLADESTSIVVMERARGTSLEALFAAKSVAAIDDAVRGAGAWLAAMQRATRGTTDGRVLLERAIATAIDDAAKLAASDRVIRQHQSQIVQQLEARKIRADASVVAGHHDDYWPGNIFFDGERTTVIDFESFREGLPLEDAAFFLLRCEMLRSRFRLRLPALARTFFEGYGQTPDAEELRLFTLTKGLRFMARGVGEGQGFVQRVLIQRSVRNVILGALRPR
jgi:aminoglycoside phosphotransferase (APT) family kinase protein